MASKQLTKREAETLTKQLKTRTKKLVELLTKAHDEKVWKPLGYSSFTAWADAELPFTYARAFQLLNIGILTDQLKEVMVLPEGYMLTDKLTREVSRYGRKLFIEAMAEEATDDPQANANTVRRTLLEQVVVRKPKNDEDEEQAVRQRASNTNSMKISGGQRQTHVQSAHIFHRHIADFPSVKNLDNTTREQGLTILLQAQSQVQKTLDEAIDKNKAYEAHKKAQGDNDD